MRRRDFVPGVLLRPNVTLNSTHGEPVMLRKLRRIVVVLGVIISLIDASAPTDAGAYTCGYAGGNYGHGCYDGDYRGRRYFRHWCCCGGYGGGHYDHGCDGGGGYGHECDGGNRYGRRFDDCGGDSGGYGHDRYGGSDGDGGYGGDYNPACRSCVSPTCRRYYRCQ
jgi:hypothetical protein